MTETTPEVVTPEVVVPVVETPVESVVDLVALQLQYKKDTEDCLKEIDILLKKYDCFLDVAIILKPGQVIPQIGVTKKSAGK